MVLQLYRQIAQPALDRLGRNTRLMIAGAIALTMVVATIAEIRGSHVSTENLRNRVHEKASLIRARLERDINGNLQLVQGLVATLTSEPQMGQQRFSNLVEGLLHSRNQLRHIAAAPDMVVRLIHPVEGNEAAIGLDYRNNAAQRAAAMQVREEGRTVLAGPVRLVQGGEAFIGRFPVFTGAGKNRRFWGVVSAVIEVDALYREAGLLDPDLGLQLALIGSETDGAPGRPFFGPADILEQEPEIVEVALPHGSWQLAAVPVGGWVVRPGETWLRRAIIAITCLIVLMPMFSAIRMSQKNRAALRELQAREDKLQQITRRHKLALDASRVGIWEFQITTGSLLWDRRMHEIYGVPYDPAPKGVNAWRDALHPDDHDRAIAQLGAFVDGVGSFETEFRIVLPSGKTRHIRATAIVCEDDGQPTSLIGVNWDVTADVAMQDQLRAAKAQAEARNRELENTRAHIEHMALHDSLTGLPNRRYLDTILDRHDREGGEHNTIHAMLVVDLDRFKQVNDSFGHAAGDALLVHVSRILRRLAEPDDFIARAGGDEFVIACRSPRSTAQLGRLSQRIIEELAQPAVHDGQESRSGASIGIAENPDRKNHSRQLLVNADLALYTAKKRGRSRHAFFTKDLQANSNLQRKLADQCLKALENGEFVAFYQPQFDARTHEVVGLEALARWQHPRKGLLAPADFLDIANELNVTGLIDEAIFKRAIDDAAAWSRAGIVVPRVSVNVSLQRLHDPDFLSGLKQLDLEPGAFAFEIVESIFLDNEDDAITYVIDGIKELGFDVEIDDFGTGHASIISLLKLRPKRLKIDRQLVGPATESPPARSLAQSVIQIGKSLNIEVVAEGVETLDHARLMRRLGADCLQGFAFAEPMPAEAVAAFLKDGAALTA